MLYQFDGFEIAEHTRELRCHGHRVHCQPKVFDLIILLLQQRHRVVSREMILREIWPGVCVSGASVNRLVKETRRTLGAPCDESGHIRTSRGRGYRFVGHVTCLREPGEPSEEDALVARARRALEASMDEGFQDFKLRLDEFVSTCHLAIEAARSQAS